VIKPSIVVQPREGYFLGDEAVGFFGNNLLEKYRKVTVDFTTNKVILHSVSKAVAVHQIKKR
jgi:ribosomal protein S17E